MIVIIAALNLFTKKDLPAITAIHLQPHCFSGGRFLADRLWNLQVPNQPAKFLVGRPPVTWLDGSARAWIFGGRVCRWS